MKKLVVLSLAATLLLLVGTVQAREEWGAPAAKLAQDDVEVSTERTQLNINNMAMWIQSDGWSARDPLTGNSGVTYPRSTSQVIFQDGMIWGGRVKDGNDQELRVGGQTYEIGTVPGIIESKGVAQDRDTARLYRIRRDWATADLRLDASEVLNMGLSEVTDAHEEAVRAQYERDWMEWPAELGAPFYDNDGDGQYDPSVDEPGLANADQVIWFAINDLDQGSTTNLYGSLPIGLEAQVTLWGYARTDALGDVIFKKFKVIYKGTAEAADDAVIEDMYFAQWSDPDLGDYGDDFAGADVGLSLGYVYNSIDDDPGYVPFGLAPPAVGYDFLQGPIVPVYQLDAEGNIAVDDDGNQLLDESSVAIFNEGLRSGYKNLPMTAFVYFAAGSAISDPELGEYVGTQQWYNLLRGFQPQDDVANPVPYTNPLTNADTKFTLDGDPARATGWNDGVPLPAGDRRIVLATGPFEMALGDTQEVVVALLGGISTDRLRSVSKLKFTDQFVQDAYNSFFQVPKPPVQPNVRIVELDETIILDWGWDDDSIQATEGEGSAGFEFEGYNLYQLPSAEATLSQGVKVATFDIENGVTTILGIALDEESGVVLDVPLQIGTDFGVKRNIKITQDHVRSGPLVNGQRYYFAVTAYNRATAEGAATTTLESAPQTLICVPQEPPPGTRYLSEPGDVISAQHTAGASDGTVSVSVVNPTMTTGNDYAVEYDADADGNTVWNLVDKTSGQTLLESQTDQAGTAFYVGSAGIEVAVAGPPSGMKSWAGPAMPFEAWKASAEAADLTGDGQINAADFAQAVDHASDTRWFTWAGGSYAWNAEGFNGAMTGDPNHQWFAPTTVTPDRLRTVELRFTDVIEEDGEDQYKPVDPNNENVSWAYRYLRGAGGEPPASGDLTTTQNPWDFGKYIINTEGPGVYVYQERNQIALSAWDIESDPPRRLEVAFLENNQPGGLVNGVYGPPWYTVASNVAGSGPREWLFIFDLDYTDPNQGENSDILLRNGLIYDGTEGEEHLPFMWIIFSERRNEDDFPSDGDSFLLIANHVNTPADRFSFTVPGSESNDGYLAEDIEKINVFPNPYLGVNAAETSRYSHFVTFSHLPSKANIRIFDMSGTLVRMIEKNDPSQFTRWDLQNHNALPVASGMYIAHIELPDHGESRILKLAIIQEQQFLENF